MSNPSGPISESCFGLEGNPRRVTHGAAWYYTDLYKPSLETQSNYLWVGQMTPYKRADLAVDAFNALGLPLLMVGDGPMAAAVRRKAKSNISFVERMSFEELRRAYSRCRALIFTAEEDFGIIPVEAMAAGRPVLAYGSGGVLDSLLPEVTGLFFDSQTVESVIEGVQRLERWLPEFNPADAVRHARRFSPERFDEGVRATIEELMGAQAGVRGAHRRVLEEETPLATT